MVPTALLLRFKKHPYVNLTNLITAICLLWMHLHKQEGKGYFNGSPCNENFPLENEALYGISDSKNFIHFNSSSIQKRN